MLAGQGHGAQPVHDKHPRATTETGEAQTEDDWELLPTVVERGASLGSGAVTPHVTGLAGVFEADKREDISGVVGSYEVTRQSIELSTDRAVFLLAVISLSLGIINLFPFLPLDGGHIFWALAEKVRGRAIPFSVMERSGFVGFALVMVLFVIGFTNDLGRLMGEGFNVR